MRELPAGRDALLLDFADEAVPWRSALDVAHRLRTAMAAGDLSTVIDVIPAEATVLVQCAPGGGLDHLGLRRTLRRSASSGPATDITSPEDPDVDPDDPVIIDVRYDGPDLAAVAEQTGLRVDRVIAAHCATTWRVQFMGFAPGFGYLVPHVGSPTAHRTDAGSDALAALCAVPRRPESRTSVPAGSVAVAAGYSAVYPRASPGGWHLLGRCDIELWNAAADPPAVLSPGRLVRFESA